MNYATLDKRIFAALIDGLIISVLPTAALPLGGIAGMVFATMFGGVLYTVLMQGGSWHATLGQKAFNLCVVDEYGNGIDYAKALLRYLGSVLSVMIMYIGYLLALGSPEKQTLHDKLAGTFVVDTSVSYARPVAHATPAAAPVRTAGCIVGISGEKAGMSFPIHGNGIMMGRDGAVCQIVLAKSAGVSKCHCLVSYNPQSRLYIISDRNSTYGTYSESGVRITAGRSLALKSGERFYLGDKNNLFEVV